MCVLYLFYIYISSFFCIKKRAKKLACSISRLILAFFSLHFSLNLGCLYTVYTRLLRFMRLKFFPRFFFLFFKKRLYNYSTSRVTVQIEFSAICEAVGMHRRLRASVLSVYFRCRKCPQLKDRGRPFPSPRQYGGLVRGLPRTAH